MSHRSADTAPSSSRTRSSVDPACTAYPLRSAMVCRSATDVLRGPGPGGEADVGGVAEVLVALGEPAGAALPAPPGLQHLAAQHVQAGGDQALGGLLDRVALAEQRLLGVLAVGIGRSRGRHNPWPGSTRTSAASDGQRRLGHGSRSVQRVALGRVAVPLGVLRTGVPGVGDRVGGEDGVVVAADDLAEVVERLGAVVEVPRVLAEVEVSRAGWSTPPRSGSRRSRPRSGRRPRPAPPSADSRCSQPWLPRSAMGSRLLARGPDVVGVDAGVRRRRRSRRRPRGCRRRPGRRPGCPRRAPRARWSSSRSCGRSPSGARGRRPASPGGRRAGRRAGRHRRSPGPRRPRRPRPSPPPPRAGCPARRTRSRTWSRRRRCRRRCGWPRRGRAPGPPGTARSARRCRSRAR